MKKLALILVLIVSNISNAAIQGHWLFNDGTGQLAIDSSFNGNNANLIGNSNWGTDYFIFNGSSYFNVPYNAANPIPFQVAHNWTITAKIKPNISADVDTIAALESPGGWHPAAVCFSVRQNKLRVDVGWSATVLTGTINVRDGNWHDAALSFDATTESMTLFVDGVPDGTANYPNLSNPTWYTGNRNIYIGGVDYSSVFNFEGELKDVTITDTIFEPNLPPVIVYVAVNGNNSWSGMLDQPNAGGTDGPLATLTGARDKIRILKQNGLTRPIEVWVRGGIYYESATLSLYPQDSGLAGKRITYKAYPGETPIISGGKAINGLTNNGNQVYTTVIPQAANWNWKFRQLFVDDQRYVIARSPNKGYFYVTGIPPEPTVPYYGQPYWSSHNFNFKPGDLKNWPTLGSDDINLRVYHLWEMSTVLLTSVNEAENKAFTETHLQWGYEPHDPATITAGGLSKRYIVENAPDALDCPGEFYLNRATGLLSVVPLNDENLSNKTVVAPITKQAISIQGNSDSNSLVRYINFEGLIFRHYASQTLNGGYSGGWQSIQGSINADSCISISGGSDLEFKNCELSHIGTCGVKFGRGCKNNRIEQCHIYDLGAGGIYIGETISTADGYNPGQYGETCNNVIYNNYIHDGGIIHQAGMGILIGQSSDNRIANNEIAYFNQTGIQIGWNWDTSQTWHKRNKIEYNYIHDIGQNVSSDFAGIYTLGISDGTVINNNIIRDVWGWIEDSGKGIYPDENSDNIIYEKNITYNTGASGLGINYARNLTIRNNIFAMNYNKGPIKFGWGANCSVQKNIFYYYWGNAYWANADNGINTSWFNNCNNNLFWRIGGKPVKFLKPQSNDRVILSQWQNLTDLDLNSKAADPLFEDPENGDFSLLPDSPAFELGFEPIDQNMIGLAGSDSWRNLPDQFNRIVNYVLYNESLYNVLDVTAWFNGISEDFEDESYIGKKPKKVIVGGDTGGASVCISDEAASHGIQSLKFTDVAGAAPYVQYDCYDPLVDDGFVLLSFDLLKSAGSTVRVECRDWASVLGPNVYIDNANQLFINSSSVVNVPDNQWVKFIITFGAGSKANQKWNLRMIASGETIFELKDISSDLLKDVDTLAFKCSSSASGVFYLDNVALKSYKYPTGDFNNDSLVNFEDLIIFASNWLSMCETSNNWCDHTDLSKDGAANFNDLNILAANWHEETNTSIKGYWKFNDGSGNEALDKSLYKNDAILNGTGIWGSDYFNFNGSSYFHISKNNPEFYLDFSQSFYLSMKMKTTQSSTGCLLSRHNSQWVMGAKSFYIHNGRLHANCGWVGDVSGQAVVNDGQWHEIAFQFDKNSEILSIYVDGELDNCGILYGMANTGDNYDLYFGVQSIDNDTGLFYAYYHGQIKDVQIIQTDQSFLE